MFLLDYNQQKQAYYLCISIPNLNYHRAAEIVYASDRALFEAVESVK
jgi:hypothetical protein